MSTEVLERVCGLTDLPSLPAVALRVLQLTQAEDVSVGQIAEVVSQDPALTAKILKLVNSSFFGLPRKIVSLQQAMMVLGLRTVKVLVLSFSLVETLGQRKTDWFDYRSYWRRSVTTAVAAKMLSQEAAPDFRDEAFIAGLLSDLGILALAHVMPTEYKRICSESEMKVSALLPLEQQTFSLTHAEVGQSLLANWNIPEEICAAVGRHHSGQLDDLDDSAKRLAEVVFVASAISELFCESPSKDSLDAVHELMQIRLCLHATQIEDLLGALDRGVNEAARLLSVDIGQTVSYDEVREQAIVCLAQMSVRSEVERSLAEHKAAATQKKAQELEKAAWTDGLTGLANRAAFDRHLAVVIEQSTRTGEHVGLILCDLDFFKKINDTYGHPVGDEVLRATGGVLRQYNREDVFVARYGGEEFAIVIWKCGVERLAKLSSDVCNRLRQVRVFCGRDVIRVSASVGAASTQVLNQPDARSLVCLADKYLYLAKRLGRARACVAPVG